MKERVFQTVSQILGLRPEEINEQSSPETIAGWDSLKHMNLILALEEEFGVSFTDEEIMSMVSVELILDTLTRRAA
jgi:acyl carrier protein